MTARRLGLALVAWIVANAPLPAMAVGPALAQVRNIQPGKVVDLTATHHVEIAIDNDKNSAQTYLLTARKPSAAGLKAWEAGFEEIPDPSWCTLHDGRFELDAGATARVSVSLSIPDKPEHYNRKWLVAVVVEEQAPPGMGLSLAITCRFLIETAASATVDGKGAEVVATVPSAVAIRAAPGATFSTKIALRNNGGQDVNAHFDRLPQIYQDGYKYLRYWSSDRQGVSDPSWLALKKEEFLLRAGELTTLTITGKVPANASPGEKREEIVFIHAGPLGAIVDNEDIGNRLLDVGESLTFVRLAYDVTKP